MNKVKVKTSDDFKDSIVFQRDLAEGLKEELAKEIEKNLRIRKCLEFAINALMQKTLGPAQDRIEMAIPALRDAHILSCVDSTPPDTLLKVREALEEIKKQGICHFNDCQSLVDDVSIVDDEDFPCDCGQADAEHALNKALALLDSKEGL
jgi:hypothetical protein